MVRENSKVLSKQNVLEMVWSD